MMFLDCPSCLDGAQRCGLPAEARCRFIMRSTDGPLESAMIRCPGGHWFNGPIRSVSWDRTQEQEASTTAASVRSAHRFRDPPDGDSPRLLTASSRAATAGTGTIPRDTRPDRGTRGAVGRWPRQPGLETSRPNTAPAYYLGRPAWLWLSATGPCRRPPPNPQPAMRAALNRIEDHADGVRIQAGRP